MSRQLTRSRHRSGPWLKLGSRRAATRQQTTGSVPMTLSREARWQRSSFEQDSPTDAAGHERVASPPDGMQRAVRWAGRGGGSAAGCDRCRGRRPAPIGPPTTQRLAPEQAVYVNRRGRQPADNRCKSHWRVPCLRSGTRSKSEASGADTERPSRSSSGQSTNTSISSTDRCRRAPSSGRQSPDAYRPPPPPPPRRHPRNRS
jgi:hypothetical protein